MKGSKSDYIGKRMTWRDMVTKISDMWVVIGDYVFERGNIQNGVVIDVLADNEVDEKRGDYIDAGYICIRTTDNYIGGVINVEVYKVV